MTALQKTLIIAILAAAIGVALYQAFELSRLRSQILELQLTVANQTQTMESRQTEASNQFASLQEENNRLNRNNAEFLKLRGEVNRLRQQTPTLSAATPPTQGTTTNEPPFQTYTATNHIDLGWNQTLVTGGWKTPSGDRVLLLSTLTPLPNPSNLALYVRIIDVAEQHLKTIWPDGIATDNNDSKTGILEREQFDPFFEKLTQYGLSGSRNLAMTTTTGKECIMDLGNITIGWTPKISADGKTVNLEFTSSLNYPTTTSAK